MGVTITDIAKRAGVSAPVVSAVVNGNFRNTRVGPEKRARIERLVKELNYVPNGSARSLARRRTDTLNLVIPSVRFFEVDTNNRFLMGVQQAAKAGGYQLKFTSLSENYNAYESLKNLSADGLIVFLWGDRQYRVIESLRRFDHPIMAVYARCDLPGVHNMWFDHRGTMRDLARYCIGRGYRDILLCGSFPMGHFQLEGRYGVEDAVAEAGDSVRLDVRYMPLSLEADRNREMMFRRGCDLVDAVAADRDLPDLFMCTHDEFALGVIQRLREKGVRVPDDAGVTGCGDADLGRVLSPALTTVGNNVIEAGERTAAMLMDVLKGEGDGVRRESAAMEMIVRDSTR